MIKSTDFKKINHEIFKYQFPIKSVNFLIKRYLNHPVFKYYYFAYFKNNKIENIVILRIQKYRQYKVGRIVDFIGLQRNIVMFNNIFHNFILSKNLEYIDFYSYGFSKYNLKKAGFFNKNSFKTLVLPNYFKPYYNENIELVVGVLSKEKININKLNYFKSDCDLDTPI